MPWHQRNGRRTLPIFAPMRAFSIQPSFSMSTLGSGGLVHGLSSAQRVGGGARGGLPSQEKTFLGLIHHSVGSALHSSLVWQEDGGSWGSWRR